MAQEHRDQPETQPESHGETQPDGQFETQPEAQAVAFGAGSDHDFRFEIPYYTQPEHDDDDDGASTASLKASILDYRRENGRTYHRFSDGHYVLPNDDLEQERLDIANHMWTVVWDGQLCLCPKKNGAKRVLDLGTGTGIWALDYADEHPTATVIGVDLSPIQPEYVPPNCQFEIDDLEKEWAWPEKFDFVFSRNMIGCFNDWEWIAKQAFENLEPGGYFEIHDNLYPVACDDGTLTEDHALYKWSSLLCEAIARMGRSLTITSEFEGILQRVGFENVTVTKQKMPASPWPEDPRLQEIGSWVQASLLPGIEGMAMALLTRVMGWKPAEVIIFGSQVRQDVKNLGVHAYCLEIEEYYGSSIPEKYAILSHTWESGEASFQDVGNTEAMASKPGWAKIKQTCRLALDQGHSHAWIDTSCIDKTNFTELTEAINSMFKWYARSTTCYAYLADIGADESLQFQDSRWFTRGWTLQELIAPRQVEFYDKNWTFLGTRADLSNKMEERTGIDKDFLINTTEAVEDMLPDIPIARRMSNVT
ncbi:Secondary metabolism regulator LAE1 [Colletotrichum sp. SAR 10_70]|nr:Secondary metabolism regulator LAE1 [Colletotrichum sp. SAR 10_71]KAI8164344.1 Secondary metabolism regulator LAE1 [Colletotrichum sp. SAR 10_65]KAI8167962.1 Secondary metabolism regulator LAE1 [Colletotrichum sp. SAR 10_70]KAI8204550.1 Secondary metabolism regulator LAE1 [Colletotrichum sp. SAR 10_76]KAI8234537.1 Secondary metabolism regulator LAE1 [Colletotrichum sp. SAR 10_86]KAJ4998555.1 Secondary metabolism regulator LAE1 [Colletotrichum sp. SAR 10_66]